MWYLRLYNKLRRKETELFERKGWSMGFGSLALTIMGFATPTAILLALAAMLEPLGVGIDVFINVVLGVPFLVSLLLMVFGD